MRPRSAQYSGLDPVSSKDSHASLSSMKIALASDSCGLPVNWNDESERIKILKRKPSKQCYYRTKNNIQLNEQLKLNSLSTKYNK